ncbi:hypothetical protein BJ508DRAFT_323013 [Ascobolus immersus RN42]|uniref:Uncharacterized protein n=1 Tax=Ascobolus immersus RN42 TaxID=1160509 RepID=A0A3N4IIC4_ASCIM|nr:hypothetical protein BJ508DRAFT_323013 [Ascobolus immersus RN42]
MKFSTVVLFLAAILNSYALAAEIDPASGSHRSEAAGTENTSAEHKEGTISSSSRSGTPVVIGHNGKESGSTKNTALLVIHSSESKTFKHGSGLVARKLDCGGKIEIDFPDQKHTGNEEKVPEGCTFIAEIKVKCTGLKSGLVGHCYEDMESMSMQRAVVNLGLVGAVVGFSTAFILTLF